MAEWCDLHKGDIHVKCSFCEAVTTVDWGCNQRAQISELCFDAPPHVFIFTDYSEAVARKLIPAT